MNGLNHWLSKLTAHLLALLMLMTVLTVLWQVFSRYVLQSPSSNSEEIARFLLIWLGLLGSTYCYQQNSHLSLDLLAKKLTIKSQMNLNRFTHLVVIFFAVVVLMVGGVNLVLTTLSPVQTSAVLGVKMAYVYSIIPLCGLAFLITAMSKLSSVSADQFITPENLGE